MKKPLNEETVKNKIVIPLFESMGFDPEEIVYELLVKIPLGHNEIPISSKEKNKKGFLDILFKKVNQPIFIVETKPQSHLLTEKDKVQAISYARQVMAPITIITNGLEAKIFDTVNEECLNDLPLASIAEKDNIDFNLKDSLYVKNGFKVSIDEDLKYEALKNLIGYNFENLLAFSKSQVEYRMQNLKGSLNDLNKKFIPELYIDNAELKRQFEDFIKMKDMTFAVVGEQGVGKTNFLCNLAIELSNKYPVLFFNCSLLLTGLFNIIAEDFNWIFTSEKAEIQVIKRIEDIIKNHNVPLFLILDAIDEWEIPNVEKELNDIIARIGKTNIKLIVSCKDSEWQRFLYISDMPLQFVNSTYKSTTKDLQITDEVPGVRLKRLSRKEHEKAIEKYKEIFSFESPLLSDTFEESKLFFMLRVISEVYKGSNQKIPPDLTSVDLLKKYLDLKLKKIDNPDDAKVILRRIGNEVYMTDKNEVDEKVISDKLGIKIGSKEYKSLFSFYILIAKTDYIGKKRISFYFDKIRDFIIAFYSQDLIELESNEFEKKIPEIMEKSFGESLLQIYMDKPNKSHFSVASNYNIEKLNNCIQKYENIITKDYPTLRNKFCPYGKGNLGMIYLVNKKDKSIDAFGFRVINKKHPEKISLLSLDMPFFDLFILPKKISDEIFFEYGASFLKTNYSPFTIDLEFEARSYIKEQLSKIIEEGELDETRNLGFATEKAYAIIHRNGKRLGLVERKQDTIQEISSLSCEEILEKLEHYKIHKIAEEFFIKKLIEDGKIEVKKKGSIISYGWSPGEYRKEINKIAQDMIEKKISIPNITPSIDEFYYELIDSIRTIKKNRAIIGKLLLPVGNLKNLFFRWQPDVNDYSDEKIIEYVEAFFKNVFREYKILVEINFPTIKDSLPLYQSFPIHFFTEISPPLKYVWNNKEPDREINYTFFESDEEFYEIYINSQQRIQRLKLRRPMSTKKGMKRARFIRGCLVSNFMRGEALHFNTPVRSFVYKILVEELKELKIIH